MDRVEKAKTKKSPEVVSTAQSLLPPSIINIALFLLHLPKLLNCLTVSISYYIVVRQVALLCEIKKW